MITILSPAKNLNYKKNIQTEHFTLPIFQKHSEKLIAKLKKLSRKQLMNIMDISENLADLNYNRFQEWKSPFTKENSKQAIAVFNGEVYNGLKADELDESQLLFAQEHVRILSGLHGILRPLDLIQPYRLEMGSKLKIGTNTDLYRFWEDTIRKTINKNLENHSEKVLINLASNEYSKAVQLDKLDVPVITPAFKELKGDEYKTIIIYTKKARGLMTRFIIDNQINSSEQMKLFDYEGYFYNDNLSTDTNWVFTR